MFVNLTFDMLYIAVYKRFLNLENDAGIVYKISQYRCDCYENYVTLLRNVSTVSFLIHHYIALHSPLNEVNNR